MKNTTKRESAMEILTLQPNKEDAGRRVDAWLAANLEYMTRTAAARML